MQLISLLKRREYSYLQQEPLFPLAIKLFFMHEFVNLSNNIRDYEKYYMKKRVRDEWQGK